MNLFRKMPHQNIGLRTFFLTQVNTVDLSPIEHYNFGWGPNFVESPSSLVYMLYDFQQTITCCSGEPLPQDASPEHWTRVTSGRFRSHQTHFWIGTQLLPEPIFFAPHVLRMEPKLYTSSLRPSWLLPSGSVSSTQPWMFPTLTHLFPHSYDL